MKPGRGRPPKGTSALDCEVKVRFTSDMMSEVDKLAEMQGTTRAVIIRSCVEAVIQLHKLGDSLNNSA